MPVIEECLHTPTETCGFNCWYFWNVGKSPALRRQEIAQVRYEQVLEWQQQANPNAPPPVDEQPAPDEMEGSGTPLQVFQSTESRSLPYVAREPSDQPGVVGMGDQVVAGSAYAEPVSDPKAEFYWQRPEGSDNGVSSAPAFGLSAEAPEYWGGGKEDEVIEDRAEGPLMKEESMEPEELDSLLGASNIETEEGVLSEEVVQEDCEEWSL
ncbi:hypothetical protein V495_00452 [Pseudogymnoascus sp. VKM F-4514 (FW-929)]|nr:hypothetical protein V495_00452 [Pseudogymnoascus sp. VKM F-4514 (FW-929)]KFY62917.1 hypothetical protein V497_02175 [Pseudogymnoascus sp. VKM F-4516 (FW-969)]